MKTAKIEGVEYKYNIDKWKKNKNILFITGISGSGKTTEAIQRSKRDNAIHINLDRWIDLSPHAELEDMRDILTEEIKENLKILIEIISEQKEKYYILEGIFLYMLNKEELKEMKILDYPILVKDISVNYIILKLKENYNEMNKNISYEQIFEKEIKQRIEYLTLFLEELENENRS